MKKRILLLSLVIASATSGCGQLIPDETKDAKSNNTNYERIELVNLHSERHQVTVVIMHESEEIANETHMLEELTNNSFVEEFVTYKSRIGQEYRLRARVDGGQWYSTNFTESVKNRPDMSVRITQDGEIGIAKMDW